MQNPAELQSGQRTQQRLQLVKTSTSLPESDGLKPMSFRKHAKNTQARGRF